MIRITIKTENAAFHDPDGNPDPYYEALEVKRILESLIGDFDYRQQVSDFTLLFDTNGNRVGECVREDEEED